MKTGKTAPKLPLFYKTINFYKTFNIYKTPIIYKILLFLDSCNEMHGVSKVREDKAGGPVLDIEEVTILLNINAKG